MATASSIAQIILFREVFHRWNTPFRSRLKNYERDSAPTWSNRDRSMGHQRGALCGVGFKARLGCRLASHCYF